MMSYRTMLLLGAYYLVGAISSQNTEAANYIISTQKAIKKTNYTWVFVNKMHCKKCAKGIARKLYEIPGVVKVETNMKNGFLVITPQVKKDVAPRDIWKAVEVAGFKPTKIISPDGTFRKKPPKTASHLAKKSSRSANKGH